MLQLCVKFLQMTYSSNRYTDKYLQKHRHDMECNCWFNLAETGKCYKDWKQSIPRAIFHYHHAQNDYFFRFFVFIGQLVSEGLTGNKEREKGIYNMQHRSLTRLKLGTLLVYGMRCNHSALLLFAALSPSLTFLRLYLSTPLQIPNDVIINLHIFYLLWFIIYMNLASS